MKQQRNGSFEKQLKWFDENIKKAQELQDSLPKTVLLTGLISKLKDARDSLAQKIGRKI